MVCSEMWYIYTVNTSDFVQLILLNHVFWMISGNRFLKRWCCPLRVAWEASLSLFFLLILPLCFPSMSITFLFRTVASQPRVVSPCFIFVSPKSKFSSKGDCSNAALFKLILNDIFSFLMMEVYPFLFYNPPGAVGQRCL